MPQQNRLFEKGRGGRALWGICCIMTYSVIMLKMAVPVTRAGNVAGLPAVKGDDKAALPAAGMVLL